MLWNRAAVKVRQTSRATTTSVDSGIWNSNSSNLSVPSSKTVRAIGRELGVPDKIVSRQPFPDLVWVFAIIGKVTRTARYPAGLRILITREEQQQPAWTKKSGSARWFSWRMCVRWESKVTDAPTGIRSFYARCPPKTP